MHRFPLILNEIVADTQNQAIIFIRAFWSNKFYYPLALKTSKLRADVILRLAISTVVSLY